MFLCCVAWNLLLAAANFQPFHHDVLIECAPLGVLVLGFCVGTEPKCVLGGFTFPQIPPYLETTQSEMR